ncbi:MAG: hypothetical protein K9K66_03260 [Desulfarculaceae bacterium]|nr:hypothetical protein [Desulfarculaceae bacterium]MCF8071066.1 hypothetical protein [Desulfarculaceae bacterium]MCF8100654.1 hypothetical protein [Desulfarculaceae bacterium]MCF8116912.1 hypothetical protein [Desulfarculaceae bacterium]
MTQASKHFPRCLSALCLALLLSLVSCGGGGGGGEDGFTSSDYQILYTYNASQLGGHTIRWARVPIGVSAGAFPDAPAAFNRWNSASGGKVSFNYSGSSISVAYRTTTAYCGLTTLRWNSAGQIIDADIIIARNQGGCAGGESDTLAHEAGHAIGFLGHDAEGLMNPFGGQPISDQESRFMTLLYSLAPGTDINGKLGKSRSSSQIYNKSGNKVYTFTIQ